MSSLLDMFRPARVVAYLFNGGIATVSQFAFLFVSVDVFDLDPLRMSVVAFIISLCVGFTLHRFGTFARRDRELIGTQFLLVATMAVTNLFINTAAMYVLLKLGVHYMIAQFLVTGTIVTWTFVGYNFIFKYRRPRVDE